MILDWMTRTRISLSTLAAWLILAGPATVSAQEPTEKAKPAKSAKPTSKDLIRKAIEAANNDDFSGAIRLLDDALKQSPDDRSALLLLGLISSVGADRAKTEAGKMAMLRRSVATFAKLRDKYKTLSPEETRRAPQFQIDEARLLAIDNKPKAAFELIVKLLEASPEASDAVEMQPDFKSVRDLPEYKAKMEQAILAGVKSALAQNESFPFDFDLKDVDDKPVKLADFKGKVTIVDVWGTWCPPCRMEIPHFIDLAAKYEDKGLKIVGINSERGQTPDENKKLIKDFVAETKINYPCVLNDGKTEEKIPGFQGYPTTLFLDRTGKVRLVLVGLTPKNRLEAIVTTLLAEPTP